MKRGGALFAAGAAALLVAAGAPASAAAAPASAAVHPAIGCFTGVGFTATGPTNVAVDAFVSCFESVDSVFASVQLYRNGFPVSSASCGGANSLDCGTGVSCVPGSYQGFAQFWLYSTSGNGEETTGSTPVENITC